MNLLKDFGDIAMHLDKYLGIVIQNYGLWSYLILFLIIFSETGLVIAPFLPGDSLLFAVGAFSATGSIDLRVAIILLSIAAILGDTINYHVGYFIGPKVFKRNKVRFLSKDNLIRTHNFYEKYGGKTIIIARFIPIVRTFAPFVAGICRMNYFKFVFYNLISGIIWVLSLVLAGYYFGNLSFVKNNFSLVIFAIILISILPGIIEFLRYRFTGNITKKMLLRLEERVSLLGEFGKYLVSGLIMAVLAMLLFSKLVEDLIYQELTVFDSMVTQFIAGFSTPVNTQIMKSITAFGSVATLLPVAIVVIYILYLRKKPFWDSVMVLVALGGGWLLDQLLKWLFHRPRPDVARLIEVSGYSFPSGHAMVSVAFYGFLAYILWLNLRQSRFRHLVVLSLAILIVLIGISRIYLGVHYPSDVLAGFAAGVFWLVSCILALQALRYYKAIGPVEIIFYNARRKG